jgi:hypothetical protein
VCVCVCVCSSKHVCARGVCCHVPGNKNSEDHECNYMFMVGQYRIYTPYMTVYLVISLPKIPYIHRIYMVLANPKYVASKGRAGWSCVIWKVCTLSRAWTQPIHNVPLETSANCHKPNCCSFKMCKVCQLWQAWTQPIHNVPFEKSANFHEPERSPFIMCH